MQSWSGPSWPPELSILPPQDYTHKLRPWIQWLTYGPSLVLWPQSVELGWRYLVQTKPVDSLFWEDRTGMQRLSVSSKHLHGNSRKQSLEQPNLAQMHADSRESWFFRERERTKQAQGRKQRCYSRHSFCPAQILLGSFYQVCVCSYPATASLAAPHSHQWLSEACPWVPEPPHPCGELGAQREFWFPLCPSSSLASSYNHQLMSVLVQKSTSIAWGNTNSESNYTSEPPIGQLLLSSPRSISLKTKSLVVGRT